MLLVWALREEMPYGGDWDPDALLDRLLRTGRDLVGLLAWRSGVSQTVLSRYDRETEDEERVSSCSRDLEKGRR